MKSDQKSWNPIKNVETTPQIVETGPKIEFEILDKRRYSTLFLTIRPAQPDPRLEVTPKPDFLAIKSHFFDHFTYQTALNLFFDLQKPLFIDQISLFNDPNALFNDQTWLFDALLSQLWQIAGYNPLFYDTTVSGLDIGSSCSWRDTHLVIHYTFAMLRYFDRPYVIFNLRGTKTKRYDPIRKIWSVN